MIKLVRCTNVLVEGLTVQNSPGWTINPIFCERVVFRGLTINNPMDSTSTDAFDLESCRDVHISNCTLGAGDDLVTIKSGSEPAGLRINRPWENITVTNCTMLQGHGAIVIGSETSGGVRNVTVSNCVFRGTDRGFRLKTQCGRGGVVDGLVASNIVIEDLLEPKSPNWFCRALLGNEDNGVLQSTGWGCSLTASLDSVTSSYKRLLRSTGNPRGVIPGNEDSS